MALTDVPLHEGNREARAEKRRAALECERLRVQAEIVNYPMPIPACDVYFNGLLEQRARICDAARHAGPGSAHRPGAFTAFIRSGVTIWSL